MTENFPYTRIGLTPTMNLKKNGCIEEFPIVNFSKVAPIDLVVDVSSKATILSSIMKLHYVGVKKIWRDDKVGFLPKAYSIQEKWHLSCVCDSFNVVES